MQQLLIREDVLEIRFIHAQQPGKDVFLQLPSSLLENILHNYFSNKKDSVVYSFNDNQERKTINP